MTGLGSWRGYERCYVVSQLILFVKNPWAQKRDVFHDSFVCVSRVAAYLAMRIQYDQFAVPATCKL